MGGGAIEALGGEAEAGPGPEPDGSMQTCHAHKTTNFQQSIDIQRTEEKLWEHYSACGHHEFESEFRDSAHWEVCGTVCSC